MNIFIDKNCGRLLNVGLLWQRSKCAESPIYLRYSRISYFGHACPKLNFVPMSRSTVEGAAQNLKNVRDSSLCKPIC